LQVSWFHVDNYFGVRLFFFLGQHEKALAAEIARNSIEVVEALQGEEISGIKLIAITDNLATVKVEGVEGGSIIVKVNY
jgi:hypothetical protein